MQWQMPPKLACRMGVGQLRDCGIAPPKALGRRGKNYNVRWQKPMNTLSKATEHIRRFDVPGAAQVCEGNGGLPRVTITCSQAKAEMYLHGAHVTSWQPAGHDEVLFLSSKSHWQDGQAIRGGIPICFPWFRAKSDDPHAPAHGVVRTSSWQLESIVATEDGIAVTMSIESDDGTRHWWPGKFRLVHRATFGSELRLELTCTNTGTTLFHFEEALHTYNQVRDIASARLLGLDGTGFLDNTNSNTQRTQAGEITIAAQTDNAFLSTEGAVDLIDLGLRRRIRLEKTNSRTTVIWNPWREGAAKMQDLGEGEWERFLCVEASNILDSKVTLAPGQEHKLTALLRVNRL
jgi:glucose-6-phosphate 1-epimerase